MATESALQAHIKNEIIKLGGCSFKFSSPSLRGVPDMIVLYQGTACFVEVKSPNKTGRVSRIQKHIIRKIRNQGINVYVIDSKESTALFIQKLTDGGTKPSHLLPL